MVPILAALSMGWSRELPAGLGSGQAVLVLDSAVIVFSPNTVTAFDASNGRKRWQRSSAPFEGYDLPQRGGFKPIANGRQITLVGYRHPPSTGKVRSTLFSLDANTGRVVWETSVDGQVWKLRREAQVLVGDVTGTPGTRTRMAIFDAKTGVDLGSLSPTNEAANRTVLERVCPSLLDRIVVFEGRVARNGVFLIEPFSSSVGRSNRVVGNSLYVWSELEDFPLDLGAESGKAGLQKFAIGPMGELDLSSDRWEGRGMGRHYHMVSCTYLGPIFGEYQGKLLAVLTRKTATARSNRNLSTLVGLPTEGPFVATPLDDAKFSDLYLGGQNGNGDLVIMGQRFTGDPDEIPLLLSSGKLREQRVQPIARTGYYRWNFAGVCSTGLVYVALADLVQNGHPNRQAKQSIQMVPFQR